ncbi:uncharacterized protein LOC114317817 [Camellia sinensis]|uniref:uncharacterized protein LOC114317817 n=1 Tax=Camellia sinensis TaxID=4442 RepID=UPI001035DF51|nr:uncharacterized protein LOC114317817 [Camellia sinensis]
MKILIWNCRRTGNNTFKRNLRELLRAHKPEILVLMETKVTFSSFGNFFNNLGFSASTVVDPIGRMGEIWLLWDTAHVNVHTSSVSNQYIHATIHKEDYEEWVLSAVYASPNPVTREIFWEELERTATNMNQAWLVAGDFNNFTDHSERRSFTPNHNFTRAQRFRERINNCNLIDLGSVGPRLTWTNNRQGLANTMERLDRAMSNAQWRTLFFLEGTVRTLPRTYSDHSPLVVFTQGKLKLNTDGCSRGDPGQSHYGGLLRDEVGSWVWGFQGYLGHCTSLEVEIWGIYRGLTIIMQKGMSNITIERDFQAAMDLIRDGAASSSPFRAIVEDANFFLNRCQCSIQHVPREGNQSANALANLEANQQEHLIYLEDPPSSILSLLITDMVHASVNSRRD